MRECEFSCTIARLGDNSVSCPKKRCCGCIQLRLQAGFFTPMSEPLEELRTGQKQIARAGFISKIFSGPFDEFPIVLR